jgi:hypothetical protein
MRMAGDQYLGRRPITGRATLLRSQSSVSSAEPSLPLQASQVSCFQLIRRFEGACDSGHDWQF